MMKERLRRAIHRAAEVFLRPVIDQQAGIGKQSQILLSLKYQSMVQRDERLPGLKEVGFDVFSTTWEDGILLYLFSLLGMKTRRCVDIGAGVVWGSLTANLIVHHAFQALLIDGDEQNVRKTREYYARHPQTCFQPPVCLQTLVTRENVNQILLKQGFEGEIDLLSIDIDGMDYWIWKALDCVKPRVVVVEYQDILGSERSWTVPYQADFNSRQYDVNREVPNYGGASLAAFVKLGREKGYRLVGCNKGGWNAFFVRKDLGEKWFPEVSTESCFDSAWNRYGMEKRFPLVKDMPWEEV